jgi:phospholipase C
MNANHSAKRVFQRAAPLLIAIALFLIPAYSWGWDGVPQGIKHIIVIYQGNWSFDSLYGLFPGANGISKASPRSLTQLDRLTGKPYTSQLGHPFDLVSGSLALTTPPQPINNGAIDTRFPANFDTLTPYDVVADAGLHVTDKTGDIVHRFWHEQSQINH